jgi:hypothetical protein
MNMEWLQLKIDAETKNQLRDLANKNDRTMSAQIRWMVRREYERSHAERGNEGVESGNDGKGEIVQEVVEDGRSEMERS